MDKKNWPKNIKLNLKIFLIKVSTAKSTRTSISEFDHNWNNNE